MHPHGMKPARTRRAFLLCYAAYTAIYLARLNLSMASPVLKSDGTLTAAQIGLLGGIFSAVYAVGRQLNGARCDHVPPVRMIAGGLALASGANLLFGAFPPFAALAALWAVNALAQSMLWSAILRVIAALYAPDDAQRKASLMITSVAVGNVAGIAVNTALLRGSASAAFRVPGGVLALLCGGALMLLRGIGSESAGAAGRLSIRTLAAPLHRPAVRRMLLPALLHGVMKDNISLWMTVYLTDRFAMQLTQSAGYVLLIPLDLALIAAGVWYAASVVRLKNSASRMAAGALGIQTDTKHMPYELKCLGDELGSMGKGLSRALDEKMKSERLKTELITNVSHDIKTPLTSIVNYVELLEREELSGQAAEYVSVLARQSSRMKKLIDDLVEASKASTGNIETHPEPLDLSVMAGQTDGEYAARLAERDLKLVVTGADKPAMVRADSRLVWRIWDNLLGNICKYAMPGTRVYIALERRGQTVATVFRNISEQPLEKSGDELTERFVRGDNSRSGEGSGLGLSIAAGLAAVQGGSLSVTADGDLLKVEVLLPAINEEPATVPVPTATAEN